MDNVQRACSPTPRYGVLREKQASNVSARPAPATAPARFLRMGAHEIKDPFLFSPRGHQQSGRRLEHLIKRTSPPPPAIVLNCGVSVWDRSCEGKRALPRVSNSLSKIYDDLYMLC